MKTEVTVQAPASSANLGAGFDVFALALSKPLDKLTLRRTEGGLGFSVEGTTVPGSFRENVVGAVATAMIEGEGVGEGVSLALQKGVPVGAGLGGSAASSVATVVGMNALLDLRLPPKKLIKYAGIGEEVASGAAHYDNVTAALAGGFVIVSKDHDFVRMDAPPLLTLCLVTPEVSLPRHKTRYARSLLPRMLSLDEAVRAVGAASRMVHGFWSGSVEEIGAAMGDGFVDDRRAVMVPGFGKVRDAALDHGAAGVCISGAGPTMLSAVRRDRANEVLGTMIDTFGHEGIRSSGFITRVGIGCKVIDQK